jgi:hypothetical protein
MVKTTFLTFANTSFMTTDRIINQAKEFNCFDNIISLNETDIPDFINKHKDFINYYNNEGYGHWIWKPKIILDTLNKMEYDDILVYCDAGMYLNKNGIDRYKDYIKILNETNFSLVAFSTNDVYLAQSYVKMDAIMSYYPEFNNETENYCCYAGIIMIKKTKNTIEIITDWLVLCENYNFLDKSLSISYKEQPFFACNDSDNGLFQLCLSKHKKHVYKIYPDECNIYSEDGLQIHHTNIHPHSFDWTSLFFSPFQSRRMTPKFGFL